MLVRSALTAFALLAGLLGAGLARAEPIPDRVAVLYQAKGVVYVAWSEESGARPGLRVALIGPDGLASDTLEVLWTRDAISALGHAVKGEPVDVVQSGWIGKPLAPLVAVAPAGRLTVPIFAQPATLDPAQVTSLAEKQVVTQLFEGLVRFDARLVAGPALAASFVPRGRAWTFRLRPDARFHDGRPVRARDVVASIRRALKPGAHAPRADGLADAIAGGAAFHAGTAPAISGLSAPDSLTVTIVAARDRSPLLAELAAPAAFIVPADAGADLARAPIGSGPFRFQGMDAAGITLTAAPGRAGGVDTLVFRRVDGPDDAALDFELGRLDVLPARESDERRLATLASLASAPPVAISQDEAATYYVGMNTRAPWLSRRANRRSLAASIDRALAVKVLVPGRGKLAHGLLPPAFRLPALPDSAWRPALAEARAWPTPPPANGLSFWVPEGSATGVRLAEFVQAGLARRGLKASIVTKPWAGFERGVLAGEADLFYLSWFADGPDPVAFVASMVEGRRHGAGGNRTFYASAAVDAALAQARTAASPGKAQAALLAAERIALADAPLVPLFHSVNVTLVRPWVSGYALDPLGAPRYDTIEVHRGH